MGAGGCQGGRSSGDTAPALGFSDPSRRDIRRVQGELTGGPREGERESPPSPTADLAAKSTESSTAFMTRRRPLERSTPGAEFGDLGSAGRVLRFSSRCLARLQPEPQCLPGGSRPGISPGEREAKRKPAKPLTLVLWGAAVPSHRGGCAGRSSGAAQWEELGASESPVRRSRVTPFTEQRHLLA